MRIGAPMGLDDIKKKVTGALSDEDRTDAHLDKGADAINKRTGGKHADRVSKAREFLDSKLGDERTGDAGDDETARRADDRETDAGRQGVTPPGRPPADPHR
ncbi:MAG TPA: antitoxin [Beutenbergiaceae bacterium]|nr:antitoxin [Beutenbergiaceae bacterium]